MRLYPDMTLRWTNDGTRYLARILYDPMPDDPRKLSEPLGTMACWHGRYCLGDDLDCKSPGDWWRRLVSASVSDEEIADAAINGRLHGIRVVPSEDTPLLYDIYETCYLAGWQSTREAEEYLEYAGIPESAIADYLFDDLTIIHCQELLKPYAFWLDLWLYDHSGITMSATTGGNPYSCPWDSGQVGWILVTKDKMFVDCNADDATWREMAEQYLQDEVSVYDGYLTGEVYGYSLYELPDGVSDEDEIDLSELDEVDACWGFYGDNPEQNGMLDCFPGITDAMHELRVQIGEI